MVLLPIFRSRGHGTAHKPAAYKFTAMSLAPSAKRPVVQNVTDDMLYVSSGDWKPKAGLYVNLIEPLPVEHAWQMQCVDRLEPRITPILLQGHRIA